MYNSYLETPIGLIEITADKSSVTSVEFIDTDIKNDAVENEISIKCKDELRAYFNGELQQFSVPLNFSGSNFQISVWNNLLEIPFGKTLSYLELAKALKDKNKIRAVANANAKNKIAIIVPCHRVIGSDGSLTGYAGGLWRKDWLLKHEAKFSNNEFQSTLF